MTTYTFTQGNLFGKSEICSYIIEFPEGSTFGDRIKIEITRLQGANLFMAMGREFDQQIHTFEFNNDRTTLSDKGEYVNTLMSWYPLKVYVTIISKSTCCAEVNFRSYSIKKGQSIYDLDIAANNYKTQVKSESEELSKNRTFNIVSWTVIGV